MVGRSKRGPSGMVVAEKTWQSNEYELIHTSLYNKLEQFEDIIFNGPQQS